MKIFIAIRNECEAFAPYNYEKIIGAYSNETDAEAALEHDKEKNPDPSGYDAWRWYFTTTDLWLQKK